MCFPPDLQEEGRGDDRTKGRRRTASDLYQISHPGLHATLNTNRPQNQTEAHQNKLHNTLKMPIKAVLFDFMGTCLDWHSAITASLPPSLPEQTRSQFALAWRQAYFDHNAARLARGDPPEDIDVSHRATLRTQLASSPPEVRAAFASTRGAEEACIAAWHSQPAWPDVAPAVERLRATAGDVDVLVHANGTARLQLDLCRSSGLRFDALLSSELLGVYKPAPGSYARALELLRVGAGECVMVAAHA